MKQFFYFCLAGCFLIPFAVFSQSGTLDNTFGTGGKRIEQLGVAGFDPVAVIQQPDGKILTGGSAEFALTGSNLVLYRFQADGTPDPGFGINGRVVTNIQGISYDEMQAMVLLPSGKILVAYNGDQNGLIRYTSNGSVDITFSGDGILPVTGIDGFSVEDMQVQSDGKILLFGDGGGYPTRFVVLRFTEEGVPDTGFDGDGVAWFSFEEDTGLYARSLAVQPDGKIVLAGMFEDWYEYWPGSAILCRINTNGTLDNTFGYGGAGYFVYSPVSDMNEITSVKVRDDGKIVTGGYAARADGSMSYSTVVCFTSTGSLDMEFNTSGIRTIGSETGFFSLGRLITDGNKVVLSGVKRNPSGIYSFAFLRFNSNGTNDNSFGIGGLAVTGATNYSQLAVVLTRQTDGKYLAGGYVSNGQFYQAGLVRMLSTGSPDVSFSDDGISTYTITNAPAYDRATSLQVLTGNSFIVGGEYFNSLERFGFLKKYQPDGTPDVSFGSDGCINLPASFSSRVTGICEQPGGKLIVVGTYFDVINGQDAVLYRVNSNGFIDASFGDQGKVVFNGGAGIADLGMAVGCQSDGKIVALVMQMGESFNMVYLYRFTATGEPDATFGTSGRFLVAGVQMKEDEYNGFNQRMIILPDDRIVVTGFEEPATSSETYDIIVWTLPSNGGTGGIFTGQRIRINLGGEEEGIAVAVQPDGKLVVAATTYTMSTGQKTALVRLNTNGTLDGSFSSDGWLIMPSSSSIIGYPSALFILPNNQILSAGTIVTTEPNSMMVVARLNENGSPDSTFGTYGTAVVPPVGSTWFVTQDMALQSDGKILLVGKVDNSGQEDAVIVRLNQTLATGVNDLSLPLASLRVTPNPVREQVTLSATRMENGTYNLRIVTVEGKLIDSRAFTVRNNTLQWNMDASAWPNGVLLITITGHNSRKTFRVVKD